MSDPVVFLIGLFVVGLLAIFVYEFIHGLRKAGERSSAARHAASESGTARLAGMPPPGHPPRVIVATDGSPCSDAAVWSVAQRPWPAGTEVEVVTVVHTKIPYIPDPALVGVATYEDALNEDRRQAPQRVQTAEQVLAGIPGLTARSTVLEGDPEKAIIEEAERFDADLLVVGSHGYGPVKRLVLGTVSRGVAAHAPCSVEIVRCRPAEA